MASGHVNRTKRPNTWLHRPMLQNVKKALANSEPSTHGTNCEVFLQLELLWARRWSCPSRSKLTRNMGSAQCGHVRVFVEIDKAANFVKGRADSLHP
jgi:hypothetical protein